MPAREMKNRKIYFVIPKTKTGLPRKTSTTFLKNGFVLK
jgi:hypothetical protein